MACGKFGKAHSLHYLASVMWLLEGTFESTLEYFLKPVINDIH